MADADWSAGGGLVSDADWFGVVVVVVASGEGVSVAVGVSDGGDTTS